jgi:outer membrane receptor for ferrienterochelin and colicin
MRWFGLCCWLLVFPSILDAAVFGNVRGVIHDPSGRSIPGAQVTIRARTSAWSQSAVSDAEGSFEFNAVTVGEYTLSITAGGFAPVEQNLTVTSGSAPILAFVMEVAGITQSIEVSTSPESTAAESAVPISIVSREEISRTPGADRTNSLGMITNYVPGAYVTHDQLHIRGGHAVTWAVDGVAIPNTGIATNVGPHIDPKNIDYMEVMRGSYGAEYGDRTYGVFNITPRTGFERDRQAQILTSFGNFLQTNDEISFGDHNDRAAYLASINGNRSDLGLETPSASVIHDRENGIGGFGSLIFNPGRADQIRFVTSLRKDFYQVPNNAASQAAGRRDAERESDALVHMSWSRTIRTGLLVTISPFYHFNRADLAGGSGDPDFTVQQNRSSSYAGAQGILSAVRGRHNARVGFYGFSQRDSTRFGIRAHDSSVSISQTEKPSGNLEAVFVEDEFQATRWLRLNGGIRLTHFAGTLSENAASPRAGTAIRIPKLNWTLRGFYGRFYEAPPLSTAAGPLLDFVLDQGLGFIPLHGERDEERQIGLSIPLRGWTLDVNNFRTHVRDFLDHNPVGNSNVFFPLTIGGARIRGTEVTIRSPRLLRRAVIHGAYSHQYAEGFGGVTGGLTDFSPPSDRFFLDHDQRHTLNAGLDVNLPRRMWANGNVSYGSGFLNEDGPAHLPGHTTADFALGKEIGESLSVSLTALNIANRRFLLDNSVTFSGGDHFFNPREIFVQVKYRFRY